MSIQAEILSSKNWQATLYTRYHQKVLSVCQYFLKDREEAKDVAHDVFIKAFLAWENFEWKCDPLTWMGTIARHECFNRIQKNRKNLAQQNQFIVEEELLSVPEFHEEKLSHRRRFEKILPQVKGPLKEILRLSVEQGLNHREIANRMGVSRVAITRRLTRFKRDIKRSECTKKRIVPMRKTNIKFQEKNPLMNSYSENEIQLQVA